MIVYNMTIKIDPAIETAWLQWLKQEHIPDSLSSGQFTHWKMFRLLEQDEADGPTFVIQYFASSLENYDRFIAEYAPVLSKKAFERWGDRFIAFRTAMQVVD